MVCETKGRQGDDVRQEIEGAGTQSAEIAEEDCDAEYGGWNDLFGLVSCGLPIASDMEGDGLG
ncbi:hypothetical protein NEUTE1DRAFT_117702 [Neurospora tetrasperma FGSC 2508]|uniref:Uncharacterized protein n=1 Tax=Neurospora tetrasperma (strain FGSC 2508 / ATCC MYA-4615 / P0657) TaxID=510951 RepID=F8MTB1_NEUT8|nr:uncharacterized protein NEUTE1DRAFT_117702 [Neurospora tetrasperma FGSC 2508]EGO55243.1 hypothetical protein NEUTE1DRAFT_117702 [Neurospora tetrasperma FGSC 2508]EGZ69539.1 hypothetical protein NEUTE2DRAFT_145589 [Neurospora tetrasperma FGSC 2509]